MKKMTSVEGMMASAEGWGVVWLDWTVDDDTEAKRRDGGIFWADRMEMKVIQAGVAKSLGIFLLYSTLLHISLCRRMLG
jgi:hypothetical protein